MKKSNGRNGKRLSDSSKTLGSDKSDDHMGKKKKIAKDAENGNLEHTNMVRKAKGLPALESSSPEKEESKYLEEGADDLGLRAGELIECIRIYDHIPGNKPLGRVCTEGEFVASHRQVRREREHYREIDGRMATAGQVYAERQGASTTERKSKVRKGTCALRTIMVRVMGHEGIVIGERMTKKQMVTAVDLTVAEFAEATGAEIVSVAVHRMSGHDLHIHVQYTMIQHVEGPRNAVGALHKKWKAKGIEMARAQLVAEGSPKPHNRTIGARRQSMIDNGEIDPEPVRGKEYKKLKGLRNLADASILGYSFRNKLNLVRAAELGEDEELPERVAAKKDERKRFRTLLLKSDDSMVKQYLDVWFERVWRKTLIEQLPDDAREEIRITGIESARDYVVLGTTAVEPTHLEEARKTLHEDVGLLVREQKELESKIALSAIDRKNALASIEEKQAKITELQAVLKGREESLNTREAAIPSLQDAAEHKGLVAAHKALFPVKDHVGKTAHDLVYEIESEVKESRDHAIADGRSEGLEIAYGMIMQDEELPDGLDCNEIVREIKSGIDEAAKLAADEHIREMLEPVSVAEVAAKLRFEPEEGATDGGLVRVVTPTDKKSFMQRLILTGQNFILSVVGNAAEKDVSGTGGVALARAATPTVSLENVIRKLGEWFPKKKHAIMAEIIERQGSAMLKEMISPPDKDKKDAPKEKENTPLR